VALQMLNSPCMWSSEYTLYATHTVQGSEQWLALPEGSLTHEIRKEQTAGPLSKRTVVCRGWGGVGRMKGGVHHAAGSDAGTDWRHRWPLGPYPGCRGLC
jgi:hypothetical protein